MGKLDISVLGGNATPAATLFWGIVTLVLASTVIFLTWRALRQNEYVQIFVQRASAFAQYSDANIVAYGSRFAGTSIRQPFLRRAAVASEFFALALASAFSPPPYGLAFIAIGLLLVLVIYRHWSRDEDDKQRYSEFNLIHEPKDRVIQIDGSLAAEVIIACAFIFVFACVGFSQISAGGLGFPQKSSAGPFSFVLYGLIEAVKAGPIVDYYDLFADQLPFEKIGDSSNIDAWSKGAILTYRILLNLLLLAALKRLYDVIRRKSSGLDLTDLREDLLSEKAADRLGALQKLSEFAIKGGRAAAGELERYATKLEKEIPLDERLLALDALTECSTSWGNISGLYSAVTSYQWTLDNQIDAATQGERCADIQVRLGTVLRTLGEQESNPQRMEDALKYYESALQFYSQSPNWAKWANVQNQIGIAYDKLATIEEFSEQIEVASESLEKAVASHRSALAQLNTNEASVLAAESQMLLANALFRKGQKEADVPALREASDAFQTEIELLKRSEMPDQWAEAQLRLGEVFLALGQSELKLDYFDRAAERFRAAMQEYREDADTFNWSRAQFGLGSAICAAAMGKEDVGELSSGIRCIEAALNRVSRVTDPPRWSSYSLALGTSLSALAQFQPKRKFIDKAISTLRLVVKEWPFAFTLLGKVQAELVLADALKTLALREADQTILNESIEEIRNAITITGPDPASYTGPELFFWVSSRCSLAETLLETVREPPKTENIREAIANCKAVIAVLGRCNGLEERVQAIIEKTEQLSAQKLL